MRRLLVISNSGAAVWSLLWLWGHSTSRSNGWEFWFALGYLVLAVINLLYVSYLGRRRYP